jgi:hypothetical protein
VARLALNPVRVVLTAGFLAIPLPALASPVPGPIPPITPPPSLPPLPAVLPAPFAHSTQEGLAILSPINERNLVLLRSQRKLVVMENGQELRRFPVAVGMPGWDTPVGRFTVIEKQENPVWEHPAKGTRIGPGPDNPLGSRWIGFHRDCNGRRGFNGDQVLDLKGCLVTGFHGTPNRWTVGRNVSHGCVRMYDEDVQTLFDLVSIGTVVTVLP